MRSDSEYLRVVRLNWFVLWVIWAIRDTLNELIEALSMKGIKV